MKAAKLLSIAIFLSTMFLTSTINGQESIPTGECKLIDAPYNKPVEKPVVFGKPYTAPALRLKVLDEQTGEPLANYKVVFRYVWQWWDYLAETEYHKGDSKESADIMLCGTDKDGVISISEREIKPVGYNTGKTFFFWKKTTPFFDHIEISIHLGEYISANQVSKKSLDKIKKSNPEFMTFSVSKISPLK